MRTFSGFVAYVLGAFLLAAALSYPLHLATTNWLEVEPFKLVLRLAMLLILLGLPWLLRRYRVWDKQSLGYHLEPARFVSSLLKGSACGLIIISILLASLMVFGIRVWDLPEPFAWGDLAGKLAGGYLAGFAIAFIEETFFRGAMLSAISRRHGLLLAALLSSLFYAALHFLEESDGLAGAWHWNTGFIALGQALAGYLQPLEIIDSFAALFAVGMLLSAVRLRTGSIAVCIGMHAAWVMAIKVTRWATDENKASPVIGMVGDYDGVIGWMAAFWLGVIALLLWLRLSRNPPTAVIPISRQPS